MDQKRTPRTQDCVTRTRCGRTTLIVSGYRSQSSRSTAEDKLTRLLMDAAEKPA